MPSTWTDKSDNATDGFENKLDSDTGCWSFQCSLKNYDDTIEYFFKPVLCKIANDIIHLETFQENSTYSISYKLENNKIVMDNWEFVKYGLSDY